MSQKQTLLAHYARILARWPIDRLRPEQLHFQRLLQKRIQKPPHSAPSIHSSGPSRKEVNAAYLLLDDTFGRQFHLSQKMMKPQSQPEHYENLAREIEEAPDRGWLQRMAKRLKGMVRFK